MKTDKELLAQQLHKWYLEATEKDGAQYNHEAVVPYEDLSEGQKSIDLYIADKILSQRKADMEALKEKIEKHTYRIEAKGEIEGICDVVRVTDFLSFLDTITSNTK